MSNALPKFMYDDPEKVAIRLEQMRASAERACGNCTHRASITWQGKLEVMCQLRGKTYGRRCDRFEKRKESK